MIRSQSGAGLDRHVYRSMVTPALSGKLWHDRCDSERATSPVTPSWGGGKTCQVAGATGWRSSSSTKASNRSESLALPCSPPIREGSSRDASTVQSCPTAMAGSAARGVGGGDGTEEREGQAGDYAPAGAAFTKEATRAPRLRSRAGEDHARVRRPVSVPLQGRNFDATLDSRDVSAIGNVLQVFWRISVFGFEGLNVGSPSLLTSLKA